METTQKPAGAGITSQATTSNPYRLTPTKILALYSILKYSRHFEMGIGAVRAIAKQFNLSTGEFIALMHDFNTIERGAE